MKNLIIILLALISCSKLFAQEEEHCTYDTPPGISPPPANTKAYWNWKGDDPNKFDGTGNFSFRQKNGNIINLIDIFSPFSAGHNQPNTYQFTTLPIIYEENDGWELAYRYFGEINPCVENSTNTPYFALYNRHTGILRIFVMLTTSVQL